jgi:hypothetical protein
MSTEHDQLGDEAFWEWQRTAFCPYSPLYAWQECARCAREMIQTTELRFNGFEELMQDNKRLRELLRKCSDCYDFGLTHKGARALYDEVRAALGGGMTKYQEYSNRILEVYARYIIRPDSELHNGPMLDKEFGEFMERQVKSEFGISWPEGKE